jgi:hypothetical protein
VAELGHYHRYNLLNLGRTSGHEDEYFSNFTIPTYTPMSLFGVYGSSKPNVVNDELLERKRTIKATQQRHIQIKDRKLTKQEYSKPQKSHFRK